MLMELKVLPFPISVPVHHFPKDLAAPIAVNTVTIFKKNSISRDYLFVLMMKIIIYILS